MSEQNSNVIQLPPMDRDDLTNIEECFNYNKRKYGRGKKIYQRLTDS